MAELNEEVYDTGLYAVTVDGWLVVMGDGWDFMDLIERDQAIRLSEGGEVIFLYTDDTPMSAELTSFAGGKEAWSITYDGSNGIGTLGLAGQLTDAMQAVIADARKEQDAAGGADAEVDHLYGGVAELGHKLVGFRHDETLSAGKHLPILQLQADAKGLELTAE